MCSEVATRVELCLFDGDAVFLNGEGLLSLDYRGRPEKDDSFLLLFNAHTTTSAASS